MGMFMSSMGGVPSTPTTDFVMGALHKQFIDKEITDPEQFHCAILDIFNTFNSALPGKHYDVPSLKEVEECYKDWMNVKNWEKKELFVKFMKNNLCLSKLDDSTTLTGIVTPLAAMAAKRAGENLPLLKMIRVIPDVIFVPSATILALITVMLTKRMFLGNLVSGGGSKPKALSNAPSMKKPASDSNSAFTSRDGTPPLPPPFDPSFIYTAPSMDREKEVVVPPPSMKKSSSDSNSASTSRDGTPPLPPPSYPSFIYTAPSMDREEEVALPLPSIKKPASGSNSASTSRDGTPHLSPPSYQSFVDTAPSMDREEEVTFPPPSMKKPSSDSNSVSTSRDGTPPLPPPSYQSFVDTAPSMDREEEVVFPPPSMKKPASDSNSVSTSSVLASGGSRSPKALSNAPSMKKSASDSNSASTSNVGTVVTKLRLSAIKITILKVLIALTMFVARLW